MSRTALWASGNSHMKLAIPCIRDILNNITKSVKIEADVSSTIIIHLRCSDVPFERYKSYHLYKYRAYIKAIKLALTKHKFTNIEILYSTDHRCNPKNKFICDNVADSLKNYIIRETKMPCTILNDGTMASDVKRMLEAGCLVGFVGSFIYYVGISKSKGIFINSREQVGIPNTYYLNVLEDCISHNDVKNYYDLPTLQVLLNS